MASIGTTIQLTNKMTPVLKSITSALNTTIDVMGNVNSSMEKSFDTSKIDAARREIESANSAIIDMGNSIQENQNKQDRFNQEVQEGTRQLDTMTSKVKGLVTAFIGFSAIKGAVSWIKDSLDLSNVQTNAEKQLKVVLANMGSAEDTFDRIKQKASEIQGKTIFGDEAMISGAAELSTYIKDGNALISMMDTLSNYASGMSGGSEVDSKQMTDYATQLGKVLNGAYDGIKKKGFELSDAQKKIIENGTDMQKALVVEDIINESWENLATNMANTPQGKLVQFQNTMGDLREEVGNKLYPAVLKLMDTFEKHLPQIENLMNGFCGIVNFAVNILSNMAVAAGAVFGFIQDNWGIIEPIIMGIVAALIAYEAISAIVAVTNGIHAASEAVKAASMAMSTGATFAATAAQYGLNAALLACPLTWIVIAVLLVVVAFYALIGVINKVTGSTMSATGIIMGVLFTLAAWFYNTIIVNIWNYIATLVNFFANCFNDPIAAIKIAFLDMATSILGTFENIAKGIEKILNKIPGVKVNLSGGLTSFKNKLEEKSQKVKDESEWKEVVGKLDQWDYSDAYNSGYKVGEGIENSIGNMFNMKGLDSAFDMLSGDVNNIANDTGNISNSLDVTSEDLKYLRDIAEQEAINRFTTAEIHVDMTNNNNISSGTDLDGLINNLVEGVQMAMEETARGV